MIEEVKSIKMEKHCSRENAMCEWGGKMTFLLQISFFVTKMANTFLRNRGRVNLDRMVKLLVQGTVDRHTCREFCYTRIHDHSYITKFSTKFN